MYCPKCAAPIEGTKFCRSCGANVSLVPQALTGQLPVDGSSGSDHSGGRHRRHNPPSVEKAAASFFSGIGFIMVALAIYFFFPGGFAWWFWLLIPAFGSIGAGVGQYLKARELERQRLGQLNPQATPQTPQFTTTYGNQGQLPDGQSVSEVSAPTTSELKQPSSITEHTTRHLDTMDKNSE